MQLCLQLENQKQKSRAAFPVAGEAEEKSSCYFPFLLCWNFPATFPSAGEPKAEISCYFPFRWRARRRNLVFLSLQLESQRQKSPVTEFWIYSVYGKFYLKLVRGASSPVRPENPPIFISVFLPNLCAQKIRAILPTASQYCAVLWRNLLLLSL